MQGIGPSACHKTPPAGVTGQKQSQPSSLPLTLTPAPPQTLPASTSPSADGPGMFPFSPVKDIMRAQQINLLRVWLYSVLDAAESHSIFAKTTDRLEKCLLGGMI